MASPRELRQAIVEGRAELQAAFHAGHDAWERKPAGGEGEDAWSARQAAEHAVGAEVFFASNVSQACGAPKVDRPEYSCATPAEAAASLTRLSALADNVLRHVSQDDLAKSFETRLGLATVEAMMQTWAGHLHTHAAQIRTAVQ